MNENHACRLSTKFWSESADLLAKSISLEEELQSAKEELDNLVRSVGKQFFDMTFLMLTNEPLPNFFNNREDNLHLLLFIGRCDR